MPAFQNIPLYTKKNWFIMDKKVAESCQEEHRKGEKNEYISSQLWKLIFKIPGD